MRDVYGYYICGLVVEPGNLSPDPTFTGVVIAPDSGVSLCPSPVSPCTVSVWRYATGEYIAYQPCPPPPLPFSPAAAHGTHGSPGESTHSCCRKAVERILATSWWLTGPGTSGFGIGLWCGWCYGSASGDSAPTFPPEGRSTMAALAARAMALTSPPPVLAAPPVARLAGCGHLFADSPVFVAVPPGTIAPCAVGYQLVDATARSEEVG